MINQKVSTFVKLNHDAVNGTIIYLVLVLVLELWLF